MRFSTNALAQAVTAAGAFDGDDLASVASERLLELQSTLAQMRRQADALLVSVAGEVARRSRPEDGPAGLSRKKGFASPGKLVADALGGSDAEANRLLTVARAGEEGHDGEGPRFPLLHAAVQAGTLSAEPAALLTRALERISEVSPDLLKCAEARLVTKAKKLPLAQVRKMIALEEARRRPQDLEAREMRAFHDRTVTIRDEADGMVTIHARLDAASAAPVVAVLEAGVKRVFRQRRDNATKRGRPAGACGSAVPGVGDDGLVDDRSAVQIRADELVSMCRHMAGCDAVPTGVTTTVVVRVNQSDLESGLGVGEVDGIASPLSAGTLRRMAVDAEALPAVLGGESLPLDVGRSQRMFTRAQKLALLERDGGCSWCHAPPSYCEAHHIRWWGRDAGPTDLDNGVMLCVGCHHRIHADGWSIDVREGQVWFTPPKHVDPQRRPRIGGRARYDANV
ncbi:HNH endonuclease signature motif containing protein [Demequina globuliformis]|uniref:HNH endonuclease signature motif containing protein n=1 Tax=Demequina globuliformis TaxID=676202 RepID=UPI00078412AF|nr:HNH endonuclease signature motif containing protein [Demequina globuliformis]